MKALFKKINKRSLSYFIAMKSFHFFERYLNLHITPVDYYSPVPTVHKLDHNIFAKVFDDAGLDWNLSCQLHYLNNVFPRYMNEYEPVPNSGLSLVDAFILYAMIREKKPRDSAPDSLWLISSRVYATRKPRVKREVLP